VLLDALFAGRAALGHRVEQHMEPALPSVGAGQPAHDAVELLQRADALLVQEDGQPVGVLTRHDLLGHLVG
jgi:cystathionine beta-synthase